MADGKWIRFVLYPYVKPWQKTHVYHVVTIDGGVKLGEVRWWGAWRKYAFFPEASTLYEPTCLRDIAAFIDGLMEERRAERAPARTT